MKPFSSEIIINDSQDNVFQAISTPDHFAKAIPKILEIEFLSDHHKGLGTIFRETRLMNGKKSSVVLEVVGYNPNESIRLISKAGGTTWDSIFTVSNDGSATKLNLVMTATPHNIFAKLMTGLISKMLNNALKEDLSSIKAFCEQSN